MRISAAALLLAAMVVACKETTAPPPPVSVAASVSTLSGTAGLPLPTAPSFSVKDANGNTLGGVAVSVTVTSGGGTLADPPAFTLSGGPTPVGTWTLGKTVGANSVTVSVANLPPAVITVTGVAGPAASLEVTGGTGQSARAGTQLPLPLSIQLRDQFGNGVPSTTVSFVITGGGGAIDPGTVTTDTDGKAGGATWRLGKTAVPQTGIASAGGILTSISASVATEFDVVIRTFGAPAPAEASAAFLEAAARIEATIVADIPDVDIPTQRNNAGVDLTPCGVSGVIFNEIVDDVTIYAGVVNIDGGGKILASASPCLVRGQSRTAIIGVMRFDTDDIQGLISSGRLNSVVLHEMLHVVGFGTIWTDSRRPGGVLLTGGGTDNPRYTGSLGISACSIMGGMGACFGGVAVEGLPFGPGTADSHWRESVFDHEVMTGFVEPAGTAMPFSSITIQSLADAGYNVNPAAGDEYQIPFEGSLSAPGRVSRSTITPAEAPWEIVGQPILEIGPGGQLRLILSR